MLGWRVLARRSRRPVVSFNEQHVEPISARNVVVSACYVRFGGVDNLSAGARAGIHLSPKTAAAAGDNGAAGAIIGGMVALEHGGDIISAEETRHAQARRREIAGGDRRVGVAPSRLKHLLEMARAPTSRVEEKINEMAS